MEITPQSDAVDYSSFGVLRNRRGVYNPFYGAGDVSPIDEVATFMFLDGEQLIVECVLCIALRCVVCATSCSRLRVSDREGDRARERE